MFIISRSKTAFQESQAISEQLHFGGKSLALQDHVMILGVYVDKGLCFDHNAVDTAHQASLCA